MRYQKLLLSVLPVLLVGFFLFASPDVAISQLACCITNGGQCNPGCGPQGTSCQFDGPSGPPCNGDYQLGETCYQVENNEGECQPIGCCQTAPGGIGQGGCFPESEGTCTFGGNIYLGDGQCLPQFALECTPPIITGCCVTANPDSCDTITSNECMTAGGTFTPGANCATVTSCGDTPPPVEGCCQTGNPGCDNTLDTGCLSDPFFPGGMCMASGFCNPPPQGCCVIGVDNCPITTEAQCNSDSGNYIGDNTTCVDQPDCNVPPQGCCVLGPEDCIVDNEDSCGAQGGEYQGDGISCDSVPECAVEPIITNVPTIGQWGMIAMAGLLGIFSLFIIMRRHRYNVS